MSTLIGRDLGGKPPASEIQDINSSVDVPIIGLSTCGANLLARGQGEIGQSKAVDRASFGGWIKASDGEDQAATSRTFVCELACDLSESRVRDRFCDVVVDEHSAHVQIFHCNRDSVTGRAGGDLISEFSPLQGIFFRGGAQWRCCFFPVDMSLYPGG